MKQYVYDLKEPPTYPVPGWIENQLILAHHYYNAVVRLKKDKNAEIEAWRKENLKGYAKLSAAVDQAYAARRAVFDVINKRHARERKRTLGTPEEQAEIARLEDAIKDLKAQLKDARKAGNETCAWQEFIARLNEKYQGKPVEGQKANEGGLFKAARKEAVDGGLHRWGYSGVDLALENEHFPTFKRLNESPWSQLLIRMEKRRPTKTGRPDGYVMTWDAALTAQDPQFRITSCVPKKSGNERVKIVRAEFWKGRSNAERAALGVTFYMHRPLPKGVRIVEVRLYRTTVGEKVYWRISFIVDDATPPDDVAPGGRCAFEYGWRVLGAGDDKRLRVATWHGTPVAPVVVPRELQDCILWDDAAKVGTVVLTREMLDRKARCEEIQSKRDKAFDETRWTLARWLGAAAVPEWLADTASQLIRWRSQARLLGLRDRWAENRFAGDDEAFETIDEWSVHERRRLARQKGQQRRWYAWRKWLYRNVAAILRRSYATVYLKKVDNSQLARKSQPHKEENQAARQWRFTAAPSELCGCVKETVHRVVEVETAGDLNLCHACGKEPHLKGDTVYTCRCGVTWDCDENACRNLLKAALTKKALPKKPRVKKPVEKKTSRSRAAK